MLAFFVTAVGISLSGVMAPGPITAATLVSGTQHRHAGALVALGHAVVEVPLIVLLAIGIAGFLDSAAVKTGIGMMGGAALLLMGMQLLLSMRKRSVQTDSASVERHPFLVGILLTAANPYFIVWWATVGLTLITEALAFGAIILVLFTVAHWLCDFGWLEVLSVLGHKGAQAFGPRAETAISATCGVLLIGFGIKLLLDAGLGAI